MRGTAKWYLLGAFLLGGFAVLAQTLKKGSADLSHHSFTENAISLSGEWEFYWGKLLKPSDFTEKQQPSWIYVPASWHRQGDYPALGFATYRAQILLPPHQQDLALFFPIINSAARIWINGELMKKTGVVSADREIHQPQLLSSVVSIPANTTKVEIVVQVSNYSYFSGGIAGYPLLDRSSSLFERATRTNGIENFFAGSLMALFIYQVILYFLFQRGKPYLWLALICLGVALRALIVHGGSFLLPTLLPSIPWEFWKKVEFGSVYAIVAFFPLYVFHLFQEFAPRKPIWVFVTVASLLCGTVVFTPQYVYGMLLEVAHVMLLLAFIYAVYSITRAWRSGSADARIILFGVLASFPFILFEIMKNSRFFPVNIEFMYLVEMGVLVFLLFQVYLLANHYAKAYKNLEALNVNLEHIVEERTGQLSTANSVKDRLLSVMSHDVKSPLNSLRGILQLYNRGHITQDEFRQFARQVEGDLNKTSMLVENILHWTASQLKGVQVQKEKLELNSVVAENLQLFETVAANKNIRLVNNLSEKITVNFDRNILNMVLRNLINNAIKYSFEGGEVSVHSEPFSDSVLIHIKDQGAGMDENDLLNLMDSRKTKSTVGTTKEKGTGLGIGLCREFLQKAGGMLSVESTKGKGSTFTVHIFG
ncbi:MAG: 7TM diverse intracellular signaling domain-containing protein [Bacteroidota bacterium]